MCIAWPSVNAPRFCGPSRVGLFLLQSDVYSFNQTASILEHLNRSICLSVNSSHIGSHSVVPHLSVQYSWTINPNVRGTGVHPARKFLLSTVNEAGHGLFKALDIFSDGRRCQAFQQNTIIIVATTPSTNVGRTRPSALLLVHLSAYLLTWLPFSVNVRRLVQL